MTDKTETSNGSHDESNGVYKLKNITQTPFISSYNMFTVKK